MAVFALFALLACLSHLRAESRCLPCHRAQVESYARTGMARTLGRPVNHPGGSFRHDPSRTQVVIRSSGDRMTHRIGPAEHEIPYYIGSGRAGRSYLVQIGNALFQSPASWYASLGAWRMSPGYESDPVLEFDRPVTPDCLFCHASGVRHLRDSLNRYADPPFAMNGITCDRCHGSPDEHLRRPSRKNIVNPVRLPTRARDSVCEACHLSGEARILNPGASFSDFQPGVDLEDVFSVYVADEPDFRVVSHAEQLAASRCAKESGSRLWCGTCHDPHGEPADAVAAYRTRCLSCHPGAHQQPAGDCVSCHMIKRPVRDAPHTAFTDHRIAREPTQEVRPARPSRALSAWRPVPERLQARNLGLAYIAAGEKHSSAALLQEGFRVLTSSREPLDDDAPVLTAIGHVLLRKQRPKEAARLFLRAARLQPKDARHQLNAAAALAVIPDQQAAIAAAERAIALDPLLKDAYILAARLYRDLGDASRATAITQQYSETVRGKP